MIFLIFSAAVQNVELASFLRWYVTVELYDPAYAKRFYSIYELLEDTVKKVQSAIWWYSFYVIVSIMFLKTFLTMLLTLYMCVFEDENWWKRRRRWKDVAESCTPKWIGCTVMSSHARYKKCQRRDSKKNWKAQAVAVRSSQWAYILWWSM